jgi:hypothetical protein
MVISSGCIGDVIVLARGGEQLVEGHGRPAT